MRVKLEGFADLDRALGELGKVTGRNVLRRAGYKALQPMADLAIEKAPVLTGRLKVGIAVSSRQKTARALKRTPEGKNSVEVYMGPVRADVVEAVQQEFGNKHHGPQPFMRPAWDVEKSRLPDRVGEELGPEIEKAAKRQARKQARLIAKTGG